jgi:hypothetical protein
MGATREELEAAYCWENDDRVPNRPEMTSFRRALRLQQSRWREAHGHPIGTQPIVPAPGRSARPLGSRLPLEYARETGANFVTPAALAAVRARTTAPERNQSFDHQRVWADLLWSPTLAYNLFGEMWHDLSAADDAVHRWFPGAPGIVADVRFTHSPGWLDPAYLNSLRVFDTVFVLDRGDGTNAIVSVDVKYHEWAKPETPRPENLARYEQVARQSKLFRRGAIPTLLARSDLCVVFLEHLLLHSMLQHPSGTWTWGHHVVVHPEGNTDIAGVCDRYRELLVDDATFSSMTLEALAQSGLLPSATADALQARYLAAA